MKEEEIKNEAVEDEAVTPETEAVDAVTEDESKDEEPKGKKKKDKKDKKADALQEKIDELEDIRKRQMAEFENFRRRTEKEKATMFDMGARSVIEKLLPVVDNFERGLKTVTVDESNKAVYDGMEMIYKQLTTELEKIGVKPIETEGQEFNPDFHNAVMQVADDSKESGTIAQELQKGYTYNDVVIRHSMVSVVE